MRSATYTTCRPTLLASLICGIALAACRAEPPVPTALPTPDLSGEQLQILDEIAQAIADDYLYPDFGGVDWEAETAVARHSIQGGLSDDQFTAAMQDLLASLPAGTASYLSRAERIAAELEASAVYEGIGAFVGMRGEPDPRIVLLSVIEGSPAQQAGLQARDAVYAVDGEPVTAEEGAQVLNQVRGPAGTEVTLEVASPLGARRQVRVRRGEVTAGDVLRVGGLAPDVPYMLMPASSDATVAETIAALLQTAQEQEQPISGMVLDLRIAGASSQWPLAEMLALFGDGQMGQFFGRAGGQPILITGLDIGHSQSIPLVLLTGPDTKGSPEIFAAALQAGGRAQVVGLPSAGLVVGYRRQSLSDGSLLNFAESTYLTADGTDLGLEGVTPDLRVESDWDQSPADDDPVMQQALDLLQGN